MSLLTKVKGLHRQMGRHRRIYRWTDTDRYTERDRRVHRQTDPDGYTDSKVIS
jgi:hypothetical protein